MEEKKLTRILMLTQFFHPEPARIKGLPVAKGLINSGCKVQVVTTFPNYPTGRVYDGYKMRLWQREFIDDVEVIRLPIWPSHDKSGVRRIISYLSFMIACLLIAPFLVRRPSTIYVYNLITLAFVARAFRLLYRCKVVLDVQDLWPESVFVSKMLRTHALKAILNFWSNLEYRRADHLIALSPGMARRLKRRKVDPSRISVIYNWNFVPEANKSRKPYNFDKLLAWRGSRILLAYAGNMGTAQSLDVIISAARKAELNGQNVCFLLVGAGTEFERLKTISSSQSNVLMIPQLAREEVNELYIHCDGLIVHLKQDPLFDITIPSKIQSYMYAARPIILGLAGDAADLIVNAQCGFTFRPGDADDFLAAVYKLTSLSQAERNILGVNGRRFYDHELAFDVGFEKLRQVLVPS
jgi:glycosyltransferase involved in cell wall biosynthesis